MHTILSSTERGQVTLPKSWRDKFNTRFYKAEISDNQVIISPLSVEGDFKADVEGAWQEYKKNGLEKAFSEMAKDKKREIEALEWSENLLTDVKCPCDLN